MLRQLWAGAAAGAAGTTALNAASYVDMAVRARPSSSTPQETVQKLADSAGVQIPGEGEDKDNRLAGLGPLSGIATGVGIGMLLGVVRAFGWRPGPLAGTVMAAAVALVGANAPMAALGITDPRQWSLDSWLSDVVPHLAYGAVTHATLAGLD